MAPRGTIWGSICIVVTLSDIETIWTKFGQNPGFSLRNSVSLTPGPTVKCETILIEATSIRIVNNVYVFTYLVEKKLQHLLTFDVVL